MAGIRSISTTNDEIVITDADGNEYRADAAEIAEIMEGRANNSTQRGLALREALGLEFGNDYVPPTATFTMDADGNPVGVSL